MFFSSEYLSLTQKAGFFVRLLRADPAGLTFFFFRFQQPQALVQGIAMTLHLANRRWFGFDGGLQAHANRRSK